MVAPRKIRQSRADGIDRLVGANVRHRRVKLGLTQQEMADLIGVTYQQAHKYEKGINRVAASRLYSIARALGLEDPDTGRVMVETLFEGAPDIKVYRDDTEVVEFTEACSHIDPDLLPEFRALVRKMAEQDDG